MPSPADAWRSPVHGRWGSFRPQRCCVASVQRLRLRREAERSAVIAQGFGAGEDGVQRRLVHGGRTGEHPAVLACRRRYAPAFGRRARNTRLSVQVPFPAGKIKGLSTAWQPVAPESTRKEVVENPTTLHRRASRPNQTRPHGLRPSPGRFLSKLVFQP